MKWFWRTTLVLVVIAVGYMLFTIWSNYGIDISLY